jgi:hypothetical protein
VSGVRADGPGADDCAAGVEAAVVAGAAVSARVELPGEDEPQAAATRAIAAARARIGPCARLTIMTTGSRNLPASL